MDDMTEDTREMPSKRNASGRHYGRPIQILRTEYNRVEQRPGGVSKSSELPS